MVTLQDIITRTRADMAAASSRTPLAEVRRAALAAPACRDFMRALKPVGTQDTRVIAEAKRRSPSAGWIRPEYEGPGFRPEDIARQYHTAGAGAISCLTDEPHFSGHLSFIGRIKAAVPLPVIRKDFLVDPWQVWESRAAGADAVLLIAECLPGGLLGELASLAHELGMATLIEIHEENHLERAGRIVSDSGGMALLGINNRDLSSMKVDLGHTERLARKLQDRSVLVSESGIRTAVDLARLRECGVRRVLVGEHLMRQESPGAALAALLATGITPGRLEDNSCAHITPPSR